MLLLCKSRILVCLRLDYYMSNCEKLKDGSWVSKARLATSLGGSSRPSGVAQDMHLPVDMTYSPLSLMFGMLRASCLTSLQAFRSDFNSSHDRSLTRSKTQLFGRCRSREIWQCT